jgi:hypothetical protein
MAALQLKLHVEMRDGTEYDVIADQGDVSEFELMPFGTSYVDGLRSRVMTLMRFCAWSALFREGRITAEWDDFKKALLEVSDQTAEDATVDPTIPDQSAGA